MHVPRATADQEGFTLVIFDEREWGADLEMKLVRRGYQVVGCVKLCGVVLFCFTIFAVARREGTHVRQAGQDPEPSCVHKR